MAQQRWAFSHYDCGVHPFGITPIDHRHSHTPAGDLLHLLGSLERPLPMPTFAHRRADGLWGEWEVDGTAGILQDTPNREGN